MSKIISVHSFRGGTGKSNTVANIAAMLAAKGLKVGVVDTDIQSPGIHILFGLKGEEIGHSLNDYLWGSCPIEKTAQDVTANLGAPVSGQVLLIPSSMDTGNIARILQEGYDVGVMSSGLRDLSAALGLDVLLIDTHPGLNEETLLSIALSNALIVVMRPDEQDYEGTGVTVRIAQRLKVPEMFIVVNKIPGSLELENVKTQVEEAYGTEVVALLPHSEEMMSLASGGIFAMHYPEHELTRAYSEIAEKLVG